MANTIDLKIASWNLKGLNNVIKKKKILAYLKSSKVDVAFVQETHLNKKESLKLRCSWVGKVFSSPGTDKSRGVAILINKSVHFNETEVLTDSEGRFVIVQGKLLDIPVALCNIYAPNSDRPEFFHNLSQLLLDLGDVQIILGGDFNQILDQDLDRSQPRRNIESRSAVAIRQLASDLGLRDIWRLMHPDGRDYSFFSPPHNVYTRIDYFLISQSLVDFSVSTSIGNIVMSDHAPVFLSLTTLSQTPRSRRWRLNVSLLKDSVFLEMIRNEILFFEETNNKRDSTLATWWDTLKAYLRGRIISYASFRKKIANEKFNELEGELKKLESSYSQTTDRCTLNKIIAIKYQLNKLYSKKAEYALFRTKQTYWEMGERPSRLLAYRLRQQDSINFIAGVRQTDGNISTSSKQINDTFRSFYNTLYTSHGDLDKQKLDNFFINLNLPQLSEEDKNFLEAPLTLEEIIQAIKNMQLNKSPGLDGFPVDFYRAFEDILGPLLLEVYNDACRKGTLPQSMHTAIISFIYKKGKDALDPSGYRPISLINCDQKILSFLVNRLSKVIGSTIHLDQSGFIPDRYSSDNIRLLINLQYLVHDSTHPTIALSLDAAKAFDCVEWDYLFETLKRFGFGENFITWIKTLYDTPYASVLTNGLISDPFQLHRSTRQGCPLSPGLFILALEPLAQKLRNNVDIHGITVGNEQHKLLLYADDMLLLLTQPEKSIPVLLNCIEEFTLLSGYRINWDKSEAMPISGYCPSVLFHQWKFRWSLKGITYLGILITPDYKDLVRENTNILLQKIKLDFGRWTKVHLTLWGKIHSIKMMTAPVIYYLLSHLPLNITDSFFKNLDTLILDFLWGNSQHRLGIKKLQAHTKKGGFSLPNFKWYYWAINIKHLRVWLPGNESGDKPGWFQIETEVNSGLTPWSELFGTKLLLQTDHPIINNSKEIWCKFHRAGRWDWLKSPQAPLWNNKLIRVGGKTVNWPLWCNAGIIYVTHLFDSTTKYFLSFNQIVDKYKLPQNQFWRYVQLRSTLSEWLGSPLSCPTGSPIEELLTKSPSNKGIAPKIYRLLQEQLGDPLLKVKKQWIGDMAMDIPIKDWESCLNNINTMYKEAGNRFMQLKIIHRWHQTPLQLYKWNLMPVDSCWRCGGGGASILHVLWSCPALKDWWNNIQEIMFEVLNKRFQISAKLSILGSTTELQDSDLSFFEKRWIILALTTAKRILLRHWRKSRPPPYEEWTSTMAQLAAFERVTYSLLNRLDHYKLIWSPFTNWISAT